MTYNLGLSRRLLGIATVVSGNIAVDTIREVEIENMLGCVSVAPDAMLRGRSITGKMVMVSGVGSVEYDND